MNKFQVNENSQIRLDFLCDMLDAVVVSYAEAPQWMKTQAKKGLEIRDSVSKSGKCCTAVGLRRANQIINGETISLQTLKRMKSFASRHGATLPANPDPSSKLAQSLMLWGVPPTKEGVKKFVKWVDAQINKEENK